MEVNKGFLGIDTGFIERSGLITLGLSIVWNYSFLYFQGSKFLYNGVFLSLKIVFILTNSTYPDEMSPFATFHLGLHCLTMYLFTGIQNEKNHVLVALFTDPVLCIVY